MTSGIATMTSKGQLTVPANIREALKLQAGDKVEFLDPQRWHCAVPRDEPAS